MNLVWSQAVCASLVSVLFALGPAAEPSGHGGGRDHERELEALERDLERQEEEIERQAEERERALERRAEEAERAFERQAEEFERRAQREMEQAERELELQRRQLEEQMEALERDWETRIEAIERAAEQQAEALEREHEVLERNLEREARNIEREVEAQRRDWERQIELFERRSSGDGRDCRDCSDCSDCRECGDCEECEDCGDEDCERDSSRRPKGDPIVRAQVRPAGWANTLARSWPRVADELAVDRIHVNRVGQGLGGGLGVGLGADLGGGLGKGFIGVPGSPNGIGGVAGHGQDCCASCEELQGEVAELRARLDALEARSTGRDSRVRVDRALTGSRAGRPVSGR